MKKRKVKMEVFVTYISTHTHTHKPQTKEPGLGFDDWSRVAPNSQTVHIYDCCVNANYQVSP